MLRRHDAPLVVQLRVIRRQCPIAAGHLVAFDGQAEQNTTAEKFCLNMNIDLIKGSNMQIYLSHCEIWYFHTKRNVMQK